MRAMENSGAAARRGLAVNHAGADDSHYRPDVDGLRAIAVIAVVAYHTGLSCPGGYVGVDVFFVISGFLITSLVVRDLREGRFGLARFWERRARRIVPAALVVTWATVAVGWRLLLPPDFKVLGESVTAQSLMLANVFFWQQDSYFGLGADLKPLLHTWSLAVEEQFYVAYPAVLAWAWRRDGERYGRWVLGGGVVSLVAGVLATWWAPATAFFMLPTRAWELLAGAAAAWAAPRIRLTAVIRESLALVGAALILVPMFAYDRYTPFPGIAALPPVLGSVAVVLSSMRERSWVGSVLAQRPLVFVGLVSYSLYLWHWPVLAFASYGATTPRTPAGAAALVAVSFGLSVASWRYVERPFRQGRWLGRQSQLFASVAGLILLTATFGFVAYREAGWSSRVPARVLALYGVADDRNSQVSLRPADVDATGGVDIGVIDSGQPIRLLLWGDSHAMSIAPAIAEACRNRGLRCVQVTYRSTAPLVGFSSRGPYSLGQASPAWADATTTLVAKEHVELVVLAAAWSHYAEERGFDEAMAATVTRLRGTGSRVLVVEDVPTPGFAVPRIVALTVAHGGDVSQLTTRFEDHQRRNAAAKPAMGRAIAAGATVVDPAPAFVNAGGDYMVADADVLYADGDHLSSAGARRLVPMVQQWLVGR